MSNTLFRKGLVVAALAGLATTAIAGTPAFAADGVTLKANTGTALAAPIDQTLTLNASLAPTLPAANIAQLKYKVVTDGTFTASAVATSGGAATATKYTTTSGSTAVGVSGLASSNVKTSIVVTPSTTPDATHINTLAVAVDAVPDATTATTGAAPVYTNSTRSVTVTAWIDSNLDGVVDAGEAQQTQTVSFLKYSEIVGTPAITAPITADQKVSATVAYTNINNDQLQGQTIAFTKADGNALAADTAAITAETVSGSNVVFTAANDFAVGDSVVVSGAATAGNNGTYAVTAATATNFTALKGSAVTGTETATATRSSVTAAGQGTWDPTNSYFKTSITALGSLASGTGVKAQPQVSGHNVGTAATALVADRTISSLTTSYPASSTQDANGNVAINKAFSVVAKVMDTSSTPVAIAGKTISYAVTAAALPATAAGVTSSTPTLTIGGVTYTNQAALPGATGVAKLTGVSDANGKVTVTGTSTGLVATNSVVFTFTVENFTATATVVEAAAFASNAILNYEVASGVASVNVAAGTTVNATVTVTDQYGNAVADGKWVAFGTVSAGARTTTTSTLTSAIVAPVVGGKANLALVDNGVGTGTNAWTLKLRKVNTDGTFATDTHEVQILNSGAATGLNDATATNSTTFNVNFVGAADLVAGKVALYEGTNALSLNTAKTKYVYTTTARGGASAADGTTSPATVGPANVSVAADTFGNYDARNPLVGTVPSMTGQAVTVKGLVSSASTATYAGVAVANATVTVAGKGLEFKTTQAGNDVWGQDSLTLVTGADGKYSVDVYSTLAGAQTVTFTSGAATSAVDLYFGGVATSAGTTIVITPAVDTVAAGTSATFTATLTDKFGNAVKPSGDGTSSTPYFSLKVTNLQGVATTSTASAANTLSSTQSFGTNESGTLTIVATYDADGTGTAKDAITVTKSIKVGAAAVAALTSVAAQAQAQTGSAVSVTATAKDAAGNAIKGAVISFTATGAGYLSAATATTDANGVATVKLIGNVAGANSVVASANGTSAAAVAVTFGQSDASLSVAGHRVTAAWSYAAGKKVVITRDGVRIKSVVASDDAADSFSFNVSKKGTHKVTVSVAGVVTDVITVK